jgi:hypothetical protein
MSQQDPQEHAMIFQGPATPSQFENVLVWRKKSRARAAAPPDLPEPRRQDEDIEPDSLDLYALSVGRVPVR